MRHSFSQAIIILSTLIACGAVFANDDTDYKNGLSAYIDGDYANAYQSWLKAAEAKDSRAMFNIGLLHEQKRIPQASSESADNWFVQASNHGYVAADYHLAMRWLAQGGRDEEANARIEKAANAGYAPAQRRLSGRKQYAVTEPMPEATATVSQNGKSAYLTESWIETKPASNWTIQILAFKDRVKVESFIDEHDLQGKAAYFAEQTAAGILFKLIYGSYNTKDKAEFARQNLSKNLTENGPWLRPIGSVQAVIRAQK